MKLVKSSLHLVLFFFFVSFFCYLYSDKSFKVVFKVETLSLSFMSTFNISFACQTPSK